MKPPKTLEREKCLNKKRKIPFSRYIKLLEFQVHQKVYRKKEKKKETRAVREAQKKILPLLQNLIAFSTVFEVHPVVFGSGETPQSFSSRLYANGVSSLRESLFGGTTYWRARFFSYFSTLGRFTQRALLTLVTWLPENWAVREGRSYKEKFEREKVTPPPPV